LASRWLPIDSLVKTKYLEKSHLGSGDDLIDEHSVRVSDAQIWPDFA
jgi:hypothetical protein